MCCTFTWRNFSCQGARQSVLGGPSLPMPGTAPHLMALQRLSESQRQNLATENSWELLMWFSRYQGLHQVIWICEMASVLGRFDKVCGLILCTLRICSQVASLQKHARPHLDQTPLESQWNCALRALEKHPASYGRSAVPGEINSSRTCFPCEPLCSEMVVGGQAPKERERMKTKEKWGKNKQRTEMKVKWNWKNLNLQRMFSSQQDFKDNAAPIGIIGQQVLASKVGCSCTCYECMNVNIAVRARHGGSKTEMLSGYCSVK